MSYPTITPITQFKPLSRFQTEASAAVKLNKFAITGDQVNLTIQTLSLRYQNDPLQDTVNVLCRNTREALDIDTAHTQSAAASIRPVRPILAFYTSNGQTTGEYNWSNLHLKLELLDHGTWQKI